MWANSGPWHALPSLDVQIMMSRCACRQAVVRVVFVKLLSYQHEIPELVQVAMEKTKGNMPAAMELLRKYVDLYQTDREAWEELAELYTQACPGPLMAKPWKFANGRRHCACA